MKHGSTKPKTDPVGGAERLRRMLANIEAQKGEDATGVDEHRVAVFDPATGALLFVSSVVSDENQVGASIESRGFGALGQAYIFALEDMFLQRVREEYGTTHFGPTVFYDAETAADAKAQLRDYSSMRQGWNVGTGTPADQWASKDIMAGAPTLEPYSVSFATDEQANAWFDVVLEFVGMMWSGQ